MVLGLLVLGGILIIMAIVIVVLRTIGLWKIFKKAGKNGWEAIIPFYNTWTLVEISGLGWWYALIIILSSVYVSDDYDAVVTILSLGSLVANFFVSYNLSKKFHKDIGFAILIFFFPVVMYLVIGFSNEYQYDANVIVSENGPIDSKKVNSNQNYDNTTQHYEDTTSSGQKRYCSNCGRQLEDNIKFCGNCGKEIE